MLYRRISIAIVVVPAHHCLKGNIDEKRNAVSILALALVFGATTRAHADRDHGFNPPSAPEVDPGLAVSGVSLLAGMLTVLRSKRRAQ